MAAYRYTNLTSAIKDKGSPLRQYLERRFPDLKPIQAEFKRAAGPLLVDSGDANAGTVGAAFDLAVRFALDPTYFPDIALHAFVRRADLLEAIGGVVRAAHAGASGGEEGSKHLARACWALALCIEVYRIGGVVPGSPLNALLDGHRFTSEGLLSLIPPDAARQLDELGTVAKSRLLTQLRGPHHLGPTFDGSALCAADADLIGRDEGSGDTELLGIGPWRRGCRYGWTVSAGVP